MKVLKLERNVDGRDFVVGDIHGHFDEFEKLLEKIRFNRETDRLISVGDHIDRGPNSEKSLFYLQQPWFFSVLGNHEALLLSSYRGSNPGVFDLWMRNGGDWAHDFDEARLAPYVRAYEKLPYLIQIETERGLVGVAHADIPQDFDWPELIQKAENDDLEDRDWTVMLWSRARYQKLRLWTLYPGLYHQSPIEGVHRVFLGHSIVAMPVLYGNMVFIDTGLYAGGCLTAVNIQTDEMFSMPSLGG